MRLRLTADQAGELVAALARAGRNETGGQLFGEQLEPSNFRVTRVTVQARAGTIARFFVDLLQAARDATQFFHATEHRYSRFNYLGEWHSHPSFAVAPSATDASTMRALVADPDFRGSFAVLMIVRLDGRQLTTRAWLFDPRGFEGTVDVELEHEQ